MCTCSRPRDVVSPKFPAFSRVNRHSPPSFLFSSFFAAQSRSFNSGEPRLSSDDLLNFQPLSPPPRRVVFLDLSRPPRKILLHPPPPFRIEIEFLISFQFLSGNVASLSRRIVEKFVLTPVSGGNGEITLELRRGY